MKRNFMKCGIMGCCLELFWTTFCGVKNKDYKLIGKTSMWMFPIYGMASVIKPLSVKLKAKNKDTLERGMIYMAGIYATEYTTGSLLKKKDRCPWDYSESKYNVKGVVRLDYAPLWFALGLLYEKILNEK
jgi:uncharacterized membrane protein